MANLMKLADALKWIRDGKKQFTVRFKKVDSSLRTMTCLTGFDDGSLSGNPAKVRPGVVNVYDTVKKEYRSFREQSLMAIEIDGVWHDIEESRIVSSSQVPEVK